LGTLGYRITRQTANHLRLTTERDGEHHVTIPRHSTLRIGTLSAITSDIAQHHHLDREALLVLLFS
jgi:predicted RNA binding protein YcfA (HicA-like mRNA interferase family)